MVGCFFRHHHKWVKNQGELGQNPLFVSETRSFRGWVVLPGEQVEGIGRIGDPDTVGVRERGESVELGRGQV